MQKKEKNELIRIVKNNSNEIYIDKMYIGYTDTLSNGEIAADWVVKVDNIIANE